jgi:hypothetical protein
VIAAALASAAVFSCRPEPGLGSVTLQRRGALHVVDLATCRQRVKPGLLYRGFSYSAPLRSPDGRLTASVRSSGHGKDAKQTIWVTRDGRAHPVFTETEYYKSVGPGETPGPILLRGWSRDDRWIFFFVVPDGSGSIAADGLTLRVVSVDGGRATKIARMLLYRDYLTWCSGRLVFTAGIDRVATDHKRLLVAAPSSWRPRPLVTAPTRSWGSVACAPSGRWLLAQSQRHSSNPSRLATHWGLWRVGLRGSMRQVTSPPPGSADESPVFSRTGDALLFVRMRKGNGRLFALRGRRAVGPLLFLGNNIGYYGHHDWWLTAAWSRGR